MYIVVKREGGGIGRRARLRGVWFYHTSSSLVPRTNIAEQCKGSTSDSDSLCEGSNPSSAAKNRQVQSVLVDFTYYLLLITYYLFTIHSSLEFYVSVFLKVISDSEK